MDLCVFQGTFNPIHNAHLKICEYIKENTNCEKIILIPAKKPPHKEYDENLCNHRLEMVKLAAKSYSYLEVSDIEYQREEKSYTFYTICELYKKYNLHKNKDSKIKFIIGTDAFRKIESWHRADELKQLVDFVLFLRQNENTFDSIFFEGLKQKGYNYTLMKMPFCDISSTKIRENRLHSLPITGIVPKPVEEYIYKHGLYKLHKN